MVDLDEAQELIDSILDCWPECAFAQKMQERLEENQGLTLSQCVALERIWNRLPPTLKSEACY